MVRIFSLVAVVVLFAVLAMRRKTKAWHVDPEQYAVVFLALLILLPAILGALMPELWEATARWGHILPAVLVTAANLALLGLTWYYNSSPRMSLGDGLERISVAKASGFANLTIMYIFPLLAVVCTIAAASALMGIFQGRTSAQLRWEKLVDWFA